VTGFSDTFFLKLRAMETVINQHGLDIEALRSSRLPLTSGTQMGDSSTAQYGGNMILFKLLQSSLVNLFIIVIVFGCSILN
jgi:hypothetical protein